MVENRPGDHLATLRGVMPKLDRRRTIRNFTGNHVLLKCFPRHVFQIAKVHYANSTLSFFPRTNATRSRVERVTELFAGSNNRSRPARLVFMRLAIKEGDVVSEMAFQSLPPLSSASKRATALAMLEVPLQFGALFPQRRLPIHPHPVSLSLPEAHS